MKIHDTEKLRKRATSHARADHIMQGTYGKAETNGHTEYQGCAVSCLATPSVEEGLVEFIKERGRLISGAGPDGEDIWCLTDISLDSPFRGEPLRDTVQEQFGINQTLMVIAEGIFEAQPTHGKAIEFVKNFAHSFEEGTEHTESGAQQWASAYNEYGFSHWEDVGNWLVWKSDRRASKEFAKKCEEFTNAFLAFCKDPTKIPAVS